MAKVIFFRGRNTAAIMKDALYAGIEGNFVVVCRDGDSIAEPGDIPVSDFESADDIGDDIIIVGNGGTTAQAAPVIARAAFAAGRGCAAVRVIEVQREQESARVRILADLEPAS